MPAADGLALLEYAMEQETDRLLFDRWVQGAQYSVSFDEFKASLRKTPDRPAEDILEDVGNILQAFEKAR